MKYTMMLDIETDAPVDIADSVGNITVELTGGETIWKPNILSVQLFKPAEEDEEESDDVQKYKAIMGHTKAITHKRVGSFNLGMHQGMSLVGSND
jgi:hypothetical protein